MPALRRDVSAAIFASYLVAGAAYDFSLELANFLGAAADTADAGSFGVKVAAGAIPSLLITAGTKYTLFAPNPLALFAEVVLSFSRCRAAYADLSPSLNQCVRISFSQPLRVT